MGLRRTLAGFKPAILAYAASTYLLFQARVYLAGLRERRVDADDEQEPTPPARLRWRVHGDLDKVSYVEVGRAVAQDIQDLCASAGHNISSFTNILDFGSGCGRVIQNFRTPQFNQCNLYATDIDPDLVDWGKNNLHGIQWTINGHLPPLPFDDDVFDLIYGISVFTHLDEDFQNAWLCELQRVARPGAILILTVHGEHVINRIRLLDDSYREKIREHGFAFVKLSSGRFKVDGFPDFYQTAFHTRQYVDNKWSAHFEIVDYVERGVGDYQDAIVLRKPLNRL